MQKRMVIGVDVGGTTTTAGLIDQQLQVVDSIELDTVLSSQQGLLDSLVALIEELASRSPLPVAGVGIGIPSMIDRPRGSAVMSVNIPLADIDFVDYMSAAVGLPVFIDNDANLAALAEHQAGAGKGSQEMVMLTLGTGIGGGLILGGRVYRGATGSAAELGHMVLDVNGPDCAGACPNKGCFEAMASGTALKRYAAEAAAAHPESALGRAAASGDLVDGKLLYHLAEDGDKISLEIFEMLGNYLGQGITTIVNIFNPEYVVVGGGLAKAGHHILDPARAVVKKCGLVPNRDIARIVPAAFGPEAGMLGAGCLALAELAEMD